MKIATRINAYMNWSGGKDSSLALYKVQKGKKYDIKYLLTSVNKIHNRISMHGVRTELLKQQANSTGIPLKLIELPEQPGMKVYEKKMEIKLGELKKEQIRHAIFGDIFLEDLRKYRESKLNSLGFKAIFPLWKIPTRKIMDEFIEHGFKAIIVCVNDRYLDRSFCGRIIDKSFVRDFPDSVDVCGEYGEYHSFVFDGPIFKKPVPFKIGETVYREYRKPENSDDECFKSVNREQDKYGFYFCDLLPV